MNKITDLDYWNTFYKKYIEPLFEFDQQEAYFDFLKKMQPPFVPNYQMALDFYFLIKDDPRFDEELKKYFSFLYSCGFFINYKLNFEDWLKSKKWFNPKSGSDEEFSIIEILN